jgi:hypothetical protein
VTVTLLRAGRAVARRRVTSDHGGRTKVRLKLTNATLRKHRGARKFRVRVAFTDSLGRRRQTIVSVALKR